MHEILLYATFFLGLLPFLLYVSLRYKRGPIEALKPIVPFLWLTLIGSLYEPIFTILLRTDSIYWFRLYNVLEFLCLYYYFRTVLQNKYRLLFMCCLCLSLLGIGTAAVLDVGQLKVESIYAPFIFLVVLICSALWFWDICGDTRAADEPINPDIIFMCGFLFYYSGTLFFYLLSEAILIDSKSMGYQEYWLVNIVATLVLKFFLIAGVWNGRKT